MENIVSLIISFLVIILFIFTLAVVVPTAAYVFKKINDLLN